MVGENKQEILTESLLTHFGLGIQLPLLVSADVVLPLAIANGLARGMFQDWLKALHKSSCDMFPKGRPELICRPLFFENRSGHKSVLRSSLPDWNNRIRDSPTKNDMKPNRPGKRSLRRARFVLELVFFVSSR